MLVRLKQLLRLFLAEVTREMMDAGETSMNRKPICSRRRFLIDRNFNSKQWPFTVAGRLLFWRFRLRGVFVEFADFPFRFLVGQRFEGEGEVFLCSLLAEIIRRNSLAIANF